MEEALLSGSSATDASHNLMMAFRDGITSVSEAGETKTTPASTWFKTVARTELQRAGVMGQMAFYKAAEVKTVRWQAAEPCDECAVYDDKTFPIDDPDLPEIPQHPNCAPAGTRIASVRGWVPIEEVRVGDFVLTHRGRFRMARALSRTYVSEELFEFRVGPNVLRVTGNHPILTSNGWAAASSLQPGDEIACVNAEAMLCASGEANEVPSQCLKCGRLRFVLSAFTGYRVPLSAVDLDCDLTIRQSDIDVHCLNGEIGDSREVGVEQCVKDDVLIGGQDFPFARLGAHNELAVGALASAHGVVGGSGERSAFLGRLSRHAHEHGLRAVAPLQAKVLESSANADTAMYSAIGDSQREDAFAINMAGMHCSKFLFRQSLPSHIAIVPLASITRIKHEGAVYNFAVEEDESYVAEGIVVHNCRCSWTPADEDLGERIGTDEDRARARRGNAPEDATEES